MSDNPFALSNIQRDSEGAARVNDNPFSLANIERDQQAELRGKIKSAVTVNPDQAAEADKLAKRYPVPQDVLARNLLDVKMQAAVDDADAALQTSPKLARALREKPWLAQQSHDDIGTLAQIEQFFRDTGGSVKAGVFNASKGAAGVFRAGTELAARLPIVSLLDYLEPVTAVGGNPLRRFAEGFDLLAQQNEASAKAATPKTEGNISSGFQSGIQSLTQNTLMLPLAFLPGGQPAALAGMTAFTGGQSYQDARDKGLPMTQALPFAASQAAIEWATERAALGALIKDVKVGAPIFQLITNQLKNEIPGEQVATILQDLNEWAVLNPEKPFSSYLEARPSAAAQTLVATIVGAGGNVAIAKGIESVMQRGTQGAAEIENAERAGKNIERAMNMALQSKLRERNPETFKQLVQQLADEDGGTPASVFIDGDVLLQAVQGMDQQALAQAFPSLADQLNVAAASGGVVELPIGEVLTAVPGTPLEQVFLQNMRANENALSLAEAKQAADQAEQFVKTEADRVMTEAADQQAWAASAETVKTTILDQLNTAGRFTSDVNEAYATLVRDFYAVTASRQGITPEQMYARYPLRVGAQAQTAGPQLEQGGFTPSGKTEFDTGKTQAAEMFASFGGYTYDGKTLTKDGARIADAKLRVDGNRLVIDDIETVRKGQGDGTAALQAVIAHAHQNGLTPALFTDAMRGKAQQKRLREYYPRLGFVANKGDNKIKGLKEEFYYPAQRQFNQATFDGPETGSTPIGDATTVEVDGKTRPALNSKGQPIHPTLEGVRNFWRWFGDSKVVDADGKPLVVYHGTAADFDSFDNAKTGANDRGMWGRGHYFAASAESASSYALRQGDGAKVIPTYVSLKNPLVLKTGGDLVTRLPDGTNVKELVGQNLDGAKVKAMALAGGHDGVIQYRPNGLIGDMVAYNPTQIKSATGNSGAFSGQDANILRQQARGTFSPSQLAITLNENADLSTFLHESGHFFLEVMADLASQPNAPADVADDMAALLKWFGVEGDETELGKATKPIDYAEASDLLRGKTEKPGGTDPTQHLSESARYRIGRVPLEMFADNEDGNRYDSTVNAERAADYATRPGDTAPAVVATVPRKGGKLRILDGGHRISAARQRGDTHILAVINVRGSAGRTPLEVWNAMTLDQKRPYHEKFAESFEQYLLEGKAPNTELQPLFRKFRSWMLNVYKSLTQFMRGRDLQLSDDVRQVFDRMLATDEQIKQAEEAAGLLPNFDATNEAIEKLQARSLRDLKWAVNARNRAIKKLQKEAAALRKDVEAEVRAEVEAMPEFRAQAALDRLQVNPDYTTAVGIWKEQRAATLDAAREQIKAQLLLENPDAKGLQKGQLLAKNKRTIENQAEAKALEWETQNPKPRKQDNANEQDLATVADSFGYESTDAMLKAIDAIGKKADVIEGMTDQRMLERHGDLVDQRAIEEAANEAVHNEARAKSLATELKAQSDAMNVRADTGRTNAAGARITVNTITEAAKQFAQNLAARRRVKDLKSAASQHRAAEARAGKRWQEATAAGKTEEAIAAKRDQLLNNYTTKALLESQAEVRKIREFFARVTKGSNEKTVERGRDPDVVNAARAILAAHDVAPRLEKSAQDYLDVVRRNDPAMYAALEPSVVGAMQNAKPLGEMTMEELRGLHDEIQAMWHLAKRSRQMEVDGNLMDIEDAEDELQARMQEVGVPDSLPGEASAITPREALGRALQHAGSLLRRVEQWAEGIDGNYGGPFLRLVFQPVKQAADRYRADRINYRREYQNLVDAVAPHLRKGPIEAPELGYTFGKGHNGIGHAELLHAILHTGNDSNKRKLLLGGRPNLPWATENEDGTLNTGPLPDGRAGWDAFIKRMQDEGVLTKAHYDFAQGVWELLEQTKPLAQKTHRDVFGRYFEEVTANEVVTPFGTYRGGYVPAQADPRIVSDANLRALAELENENMAFSFPTTNKGFTKGRVEYNRPLMLDLRTIGQHIDKVLLFAHMEPAVRDVNKLLSRKGISYSLSRIDPTIYAGMLTPWLSRSARQIVETPVVGDGGISRMLTAARSRAGMALMFANLSNALQQVTGFATAFSKIKADGLRPQMMRATAQFIANPRKMAQAVAKASPFMDQRMANELSNINDAMDKILLDPSLYERSQAWAQKHAYFLQTAFANTMEPIIWTAGYNGALEKGASEAEAARYADGLIRQTQGSTLPEDVSRIETGPAYARMFTQFIGYFNMMANTNATGLKQIAQDVGIKKGAGKALMIVTMGMLVPLWAAEAIAQAMRGGPDDEDKDGYLDDWLAAVFGMGTIKGMFAMVPFVGQAANAGLSRFNNNPADDKISLSPAVGMLEATVGLPSQVYKAMHDPDKINARNAVRDVASAISLTTGLPAYTLARPLSYLAGVESGKIEPTSPADAVRGAITGTPSPDSKQR